MARPKRDGNPDLLTEVELELMSALWDLGEGTVRDVLGRLPAGRDLAYTSVSTIVRILEKKGLVTSRKAEGGRAHLYRPTLPKQEYEGRSVRHMVDKVFDGTPAAMVRRLIDDEGLTRDELRDIERALREKLER